MFVSSKLFLNMNKNTDSFSYRCLYPSPAFHFVMCCLKTSSDKYLIHEHCCFPLSYNISVETKSHERLNLISMNCKHFSFLKYGGANYLANHSSPLQNLLNINVCDN